MVFGFKKKKASRVFRLGTFSLVYLLSCLLIVPSLAKLNGRTALPVLKNKDLAPHNYLTVLCNRHYVKPSLKNNLNSVASTFESQHGLKLIYLDANFPFINGFPLLPHLSHNDGKKVDLAFQYLRNGFASNKKPSRSGYGFFEKPKFNESDQNKICKAKGHWQYDFPKYLSFGSRSDLSFDEDRTRFLISLLLKMEGTQKIFIEPHLQQRMKLNNNKIRYQGCHSVRHDDHIHLQIN